MKKLSQIKLQKEFSNYLDYWMQSMLSQNQKEILPEMSQDSVPNKLADMGSMYLSRILYGASRACTAMEDNSFMRSSWSEKLKSSIAGDCELKII